MALERPYEKEIRERDAEHERGARRDHWRDLLKTALQLAFWVAAGFTLIAWSAHTRDDFLGRKILFPAGQMVWLCGVLFTLLAAYRRGERRGDW